MLRDHKLAILSNGSPRNARSVESVHPASVDACTEVISVDQVKVYKPEPACYALVEMALQVAKEEVLFISSNGFDVTGAKRYGFKVAWIERGGDVLPTKTSLSRTG